MAIYFIIAALCGLIVGSAEIFSRYKDEPFKAVFCGWGISYLLLNSLLSALAFWLIVLSNTVTNDMAVIHKLQYSVLAGFGAVLVMRTKLFSVKSEAGEPISIGPDFVISTYLNMMDRQIDRRRAIDRSRLIKKKMENIDFGAAEMAVVTLLMNSMQNLSSSEKEKLGVRIKEIEEASELSNQDKANMLGFVILDYGGEEFFKEVFTEQERAKYVIQGISKCPPAK